MRTTRLFLAFVAAAFLPVAMPARAEPPVPLLWKVSDADSSIYLLGSFHMLTRDDYPLAADVEAAFADAESLAFELSPEEANSPGLPAQMARAALRKRPGTLQQDLGPQLWSRLEAYAKANGLPLAQLAAFDPWFIALSVSLTEMARMGLDPALGLDRHFMDAAARAGKPAAGLEQASGQIAVLAGMTALEQTQMLAESLEQAEQGPRELRDMHAAWRAGDAERLWNRMAADMKRDYPALYRRINVERNDAWLPKLERELARKDDDVLVVVGALHLLGGDGVVEKLRARGYRVERICSACAR
ncbi:TraB/GumN family protein [Pseudoxanthomonas sp. 10H]|uniref:TraB/GumN family protein n=1 Tax=Pseudoxanthomonas sp. 10H TaxID=3242729 RepID=UPI00355903BE